MLKKLYIAALFLTVSAVMGQGVDFSRISAEVCDPLSQYYYPTLYNRYVMMDTTLNEAEYYHLYYGYPTQEGYKPLLKNEYGDSLRTVLNNRRGFNAETFFQAMEYARKILATEPFNLREINVLAYCYNMLGDSASAEKEMYRLRMITRIITSTGNGESEKRPWWVIQNSHADDILALRKFTADKTVALSRDVFFIQAIGENRKRSDIFYFNYSLQYMKEPEYLKDQNGKRIQKEKWNPFK